MKKVFNPFILLCTAIVLFMTAACSEEETLMDKVLSDVNNTKWLAVNDSESYELTFKDGIYTLKYNGQIAASGSYTQSQRNITFQQKQFVTYSIMTLKEGEISESSFMQVPVYYAHSYAENEIAFTLKFTPVE